MKNLRKKYCVFLLLMLVGAGIISAQNIQLHYDFGDSRKMITSTVEYFHIDKIGNTFFFIDFDYGGKTADVKGVSGAYWELAREINIMKSDFALHAEFNSGMFRTNDFSGQINNAFLLGASYTFHSEDFSKTLSLQSLYKLIANKNVASFQLTVIWGFHFLDGKLSLMGFADFWREDVLLFNQDGDVFNKRYIFLSETQIWYNISDAFSLGSELEFSNNFGGHLGSMINPTLAVKWNIK